MYCLYKMRKIWTNTVHSKTCRDKQTEGNNGTILRLNFWLRKSHAKSFHIFSLSTILPFIFRSSHPRPPKNLFWRRYFYFSILYFSRTFANHTTVEEEGGISLTPHCNFHPLHRHLGISLAIAAESSPLHMASRRNRTGNLWFPSASH